MLPVASNTVAAPGVLNDIVVLFSATVSKPPTLIPLASSLPVASRLAILLGAVPVDIDVVAYSPLLNLINADPTVVSVTAVSGTPSVVESVVFTTVPDSVNPAPVTSVTYTTFSLFVSPCALPVIEPCVRVSPSLTITDEVNTRRVTLGSVHSELSKSLSSSASPNFAMSEKLTALASPVPEDVLAYN